MEGVRRGVAAWPDPLTLEHVVKVCAQQERSLRMQYEGDVLPPDWEQGLAHPRRQPETMQGAVSRFAYLTHLYRIRSENLAQREAGDPEELAGKMLRREPIRVDLSFGTVEVTGRSLNAMAEIAAHALTIQSLRDDLRRAARLADHCSGARLRRLARVQRRIVMEIGLQRRAIYAHAFTADGAPARHLEDAPRWADSVTAEDDARLLSALFDVNHGRIDRLQAAMPEKEPPKKKSVEFGWHSLIATIAPKMGIPSSRMYDTDLPKTLAFALASTPQWEDLE